MSKSFKIERPTNSRTIGINDSVNIEPEDNLNLHREVEDIHLSNKKKNNERNSKPQLTNDDINTSFKKPKLVPMEGLDLLSNPKKINNESSANEYSAHDSEPNSISSDNESVKASFGNYFTPNNDEKDTSDNEFFNNHKYDSDDDKVSNHSLSDISDRDEPRQREKTYEEVQREKQFFLFKLNRMEKQMGVKLPRRFTMASNIDDMKLEYEKLKRERDVDKSVKFQRKALMAFSSGIEYLNNKFDPVDAKLDGWSENVMESIDDYDEVFEELHDKYAEKVQVAPEIKLLMMVGGSAVMFHLTKTLFNSSKIGNIDDILKENPNIMRDIQNAAMNKMENNAGREGSAFTNVVREGLNMQQQKHTGRGMRGPQNVDDLLSSEDVSASDIDRRSFQNRRRQSMKRGINIDV